MADGRTFSGRSQPIFDDLHVLDSDEPTIEGSAIGHRPSAIDHRPSISAIDLRHRIFVPPITQIFNWFSFICNTYPNQTQLVDLSVIIVNYNVKYFLEQCLFSVQQASGGLAVETIVVDNRSTDNSLSYLQPKFPSVRFISNAENRGFAQASNQGLKYASGKYILFLNPDTILPEDCLRKSIEFLANTPGAGALGIKMIDGSGNFLRESKRSFPSPMTSFYKLTGLARLFPKSKVFARYHLGNLDENKDHAVDVLAGAFMLIKKQVLDQTGSFDETFFMYGEDVDLSYRIQKAGFTNHYFAGSSIIHFKGESTKRGSMNYVRMFYNAMSIFVRKHYGGKEAGIFNFFIHLAIWARAALSATGTFIRKIGLPLIDAILILISFWVMKNIWNLYVRTDTQYETRILWMAFPGFTIVYLVAAYYAGLYDRSYKISELIRSTLIATIVLLAGYSLLPEDLRFSRGIILFGAILAFLLITVFRKILIRTSVLTVKDGETHANTLIVGSITEYENCISLIKDAATEQNVIGRASVDPDDNTGIAKWPAIKEINRSFSLKEIIFCQGVLSFKDIVDFLPRIEKKTRVMIHSFGSGSIVGSRSGSSAGEFVSTERGFLLSDPYRRRLQ
ncbi:MAG: glycosyltransferase [Chitinophagaceae bacterium]|nr:glycosyltransferase [Chitinophagaceae bacterium]